MVGVLNRLQDLLDATRAVDWLGPLALRLYLFPVFFVAGMNKVSGWENTVAWFGNPDWGLGLPAPVFLAALATGAEVVGAVALLIGFATRWFAIPLMITMIVAATSVHWDSGWQYVHDAKSPFASQYVGGSEAQDVSEAGQRLDRAKAILRQNGNYSWLTEKGNFAIINGGVELAVTYFVMLLALFFTGAGKFFSLDYWIRRRFRPDES